MPTPDFSMPIRADTLAIGIAAFLVATQRQDKQCKEACQAGAWQVY
jgi:hypothetical protein